jgi:hypothetical protein
MNMVVVRTGPTGYTACAIGLDEFNKLGTIVYREISVLWSIKSSKITRRKSGRTDLAKIREILIVAGSVDSHLFSREQFNGRGFAYIHQQGSARSLL